MAEQKKVEEKEIVSLAKADTTAPTASAQDNNQKPEEKSGESHHHHHHSSSHHHHHHGSGSHRSGSHHHSSHHRHSHGKHSSRKKNVFSRFRRFFRKLNNKKRISFVCAIIFALIILFASGMDIVEYIWAVQAEKNANSQDAKDPTDILQLELINPDGKLITDAVERYLSINLLAEHQKNTLVANFVESGVRYDMQNPVAIKLATRGSVASLYMIEYATNSRYDGALVDYFTEKEGTYVFKHLYSNTKYYYRVTAFTTIGVVSETGYFLTSDTPRILTIEGIENVRDIGNWKTDSGVRIKQGMLYRGTELDGAIETPYHLTNAGMSDMLDILGIKFDMDLRSEVGTPLASDALGSRVEHKYYDMAMYEGIFTDEGKARMKEVFTDLANPKNYPMYMHCTYGCDRTGTVCYILEAMLGVSRGDCLKEYGLSNMSVASIEKVEAGLAAYGEGLSLKEQAELYLISCGVTMDDINAIRGILLEPKEGK